MKAVFDGIMTKYNASTTLKTANVYGLHLNVVPDNTPFPYTVYYNISGHPNDTFIEYIENMTIQFNIYSDTSGSAEVNDIYTKLTAAFDYCSLTVSGYSHIYMRRIFSYLMWDVEEKVWQYIVQYNLEVQKS